MEKKVPIEEVREQKVNYRIIIEIRGNSISRSIEPVTVAPRPFDIIGALNYSAMLYSIEANLNNMQTWIEKAKETNELIDNTRQIKKPNS